jgi:transcription elongation factor Elf1
MPKPSTLGWSLICPRCGEEAMMFSYWHKLDEFTCAGCDNTFSRDDICEFLTKVNHWVEFLDWLDTAVANIPDPKGSK